MITVYGTPVSPFVRKVCLVLDEKKLPYQLEIVRPRFTPMTSEFLKISPLAKIPAITDGDFALADSSVICAYLEKRYPEHSILPNDANGYARTLWIEEYADTVLANSAVFAVFFNKIVAPLMQKPSDNNALEHALNVELPVHFDYLEQQLLNSKKYFVNNCYTLADISITAMMVNFHYAGNEVDKKRWPNFHNYLQFHFEQPVLNSYIEEGKQLLEMYKAGTWMNYSHKYLGHSSNFPG